MPHPQRTHSTSARYERLRRSRHAADLFVPLRSNALAKSSSRPRQSAGRIGPLLRAPLQRDDGCRYDGAPDLRFQEGAARGYILRLRHLQSHSVAVQAEASLRGRASGSFDETSRDPAPPVHFKGYTYHGAFATNLELTPPTVWRFDCEGGSQELPCAESFCCLPAEWLKGGTRNLLVPPAKYLLEGPFCRSSASHVLRTTADVIDFAKAPNFVLPKTQGI